MSAAETITQAADHLEAMNAGRNPRSYNYRTDAALAKAFRDLAWEHENPHICISRSADGPYDDPDDCPTIQSLLPVAKEVLSDA